MFPNKIMCLFVALILGFGSLGGIAVGTTDDIYTTKVEYDSSTYCDESNKSKYPEADDGYEIGSSQAFDCESLCAYYCYDYYYNEYYDKYKEIKPAYIGIMPFSGTPVTDQAGLQDAINAAPVAPLGSVAAEEVIYIMNDITLTSAIIINEQRNIRITSNPLAGQRFTIYAAPGHRHIHINTTNLNNTTQTWTIPLGTTLILHNIVLDGGHILGETISRGGIRNRGGSLYMREDSVIQNCAWFDSNPVRTNPNLSCIIGSGGAIHHGRTYMFDNATIRNNHALYGAGKGGGRLEMHDNSQIYNNHASRGGGGFLGNFMQVGAGVVTSWDTRSVGTMHDNALIHSNTAGRRGGGIYIGVASGTGLRMFEMSSSLSNTAGILNNHVTYAGTTYTSDGGGGIFALGGRVYIHGGQVSNNTVTRNSTVTTTQVYGGGGIFIDGRNPVWGGSANWGERSLVITDGIIQNNIVIHDGSPVGTQLGAGGVGGGIAVTDAARFEMNGGIIQDNTAPHHGGGLSIRGDGVTVITGGTIYDNDAAVDGGGIHFMRTTDLIIENDAVIESNAADRGGGIFFVGGRTTPAGTASNPARSLILQDNVEINNNQAREGGGVFIASANAVSGYDRRNLTMLGGTISGNEATERGGGVFVQTIAMPTASPDPTVAQSNAAIFNMVAGSIIENSAELQGGGVFVQGSSVHGEDTANNHGLFNMTGGLLSQNEADYGGGVFVMRFARMIAQNASITDNTATEMGGGIFTERHIYANPLPMNNQFVSLPANVNEYSNLNLTNVTFGGNSAREAYPSPINALAAISVDAWVANTLSAGTHPLNNYDINFTGTANLQTITFNPNGGVFAGAEQLPTRSILNTGTYVAAFNAAGNLVSPNLAHPTKTGYTFGGWFDSQANADGTTQVGRVLHTTNVTSDSARTLWARWTVATTPPPSGSGGGGGAPPTTIEPDEPPLTPFTSEHVWFVRGFPAGDFRPGNSITRAEISMILFRLLDSAEKYAPKTNNFSDVSTGWYAQAVSYLASRNIVTGYPDGTFRPNAPITRAELTAIVSRFFELHEADTLTFSDVSDLHWAIAYINNAVARGWVIGFEDDTFRPNNATTRAEAVTMLNRVLVRRPNPDTVNYHLDGKQLFTDVNSSHWAFYDIMEAAIDHEFTLDEDELEIWSSIYIPWRPVN